MSVPTPSQAHTGDWLPSPYDLTRQQHRLAHATRAGLMSACGYVLVTYPNNDPRVPWTTWPHCRACQPPQPPDRTHR